MSRARSPKRAPTRARVNNSFAAFWKANKDTIIAVQLVGVGNQDAPPEHDIPPSTWNRPLVGTPAGFDAKAGFVFLAPQFHRGNVIALRIEHIVHVGPATDRDVKVYEEIHEAFARWQKSHMKSVRARQRTRRVSN